MKLNHIIIGAGRSGTTSLVEYLKQHNAVNFSSIKEVTYFSINDHFERGKDYLHSFFDKDGVVNATSDTYLLMSKEAPRRISEYNPYIKITVILREPGARAYSNYNFSVNHGYINEDTSFVESENGEDDILKQSDIIKQNNYCHFDGSLYHKHLSYWTRFFKKEQLFICTTNQLRDSPQELMNSYFDFLSLDKIKIKELTAQHKAASVKSKKLNKFLVNRDHWLRKLVRIPLQIGFVRKLVLKSNVVDNIKDKNREEVAYEPMTDKEKEFSVEYFKEDLANLKKEFGISFQ